MLSTEINRYYNSINDGVSYINNHFTSILKLAEDIQAVEDLVVRKIVWGSKQSNAGSGMFYYLVDESNLDSAIQYQLLSYVVNENILDLLLEVQNLKKFLLDKGILKEFENISASLDSTVYTCQAVMQKQDENKNKEELCRYIKDFYINYTTLKNSVEFYTSLEYEDIESDNTLSLELLDTEYSVEEFYKKLELLQSIYEAIGNYLYRNNGDTYPKLEIVKIESGSLLSKVLGDENILQVIGILLKKTVDLVFSKYTKEGILVRNSDVMKAIKEDAEIAEYLKNRGYNVAEAEENITKSFTIATKGLLQLAGAAPKIRINDTELSIDLDFRQKYIDDSMKLIEDKGKESKDTEKEFQENK